MEPETRIGRALTERYLGEGIASIDDTEVAEASRTASLSGSAVLPGKPWFLRPGGFSRC